MVLQTAPETRDVLVFILFTLRLHFGAALRDTYLVGRHALQLVQEALNRSGSSTDALTPTHPPGFGTRTSQPTLWNVLKTLHFALLVLCGWNAHLFGNTGMAIVCYETALTEWRTYPLLPGPLAHFRVQYLLLALALAYHQSGRSLRALVIAVESVLCTAVEFRCGCLVPAFWNAMASSASVLGELFVGSNAALIRAYYGRASAAAQQAGNTRLRLLLHTRLIGLPDRLLGLALPVGFGGLVRAGPPRPGPAVASEGSDSGDETSTEGSDFDIPDDILVGGALQLSIRAPAEVEEADFDRVDTPSAPGSGRGSGSGSGFGTRDEAGESGGKLGQRGEWRRGWCWRESSVVV